ncbi:MAG: undecaprenyl-diphosphatase [Actinomycetota bacterium]|nr:undecaprenyl-diphosphatase [Actinomycetota bacterium]
MSILHAIILGIVQGATEFAPVSSSGHLILVPWLFNWQELLSDPALNKTFDVALHMGTLLGALIYFRTDVVKYAKAFAASVAHRRIGSPEERLAWALVIGTIPGALLGALFESVIEKKLGEPWIIAVMLAVFGVVLYVVDRKMRDDRKIDDIGPRDGLALGLAQAIALQPGVSRSGITMTAARLLGLDRESAARFSFLLAMPIIAGAGVLKAFDLAQTGFGGNGAAFAWGFISSAVSGFIVIWGLLGYLRKHTFKVFMIYRLIIAAIVLGVIATGTRSATIPEAKTAPVTHTAAASALP